MRLTVCPLAGLVRLLTLMLIFLVIPEVSAKDYARLELKANRFYHQQEWAQAAATYYQMLDLKPTVPVTYGRAIVANAMRQDSSAAVHLMHRALANKVPFDSVLSRVKLSSFALGKPNLYGDFLLKVKESFPWLKRPVDNYLLRYYTFRHDGKKMMQLSDVMLSGAPDNIGFLMTKAQGAMLCGEYQTAKGLYNRILELQPQDFDALMDLGMFYRLDGDNQLAGDLLAKAYAIHPAPYLEQVLKELGVTVSRGPGSRR